MKIKILLVCLLLLNGFYGYAQNQRADSLLAVLKAELGRENFYNLKKEKRINVLRNDLRNADSKDFTTQYSLCSKIFEEYRSFKFDSAFVYINKMISLSEKFRKKDQLIESNIQLGTTYLNSGFYKEAFDVIAQIDTGTLTNKLKTDYLVLRSRLNAGIGDYDNDVYLSQLYHKKSDEDFRRAEITTPANAFEQTINLAFNADSVKTKKLTPDFFYHFIINHHLPPHDIAMVATRISFAYNGEDRILFLALAAINDVRSSTKETLAVFLLGQTLFEQKKNNDAYIFMQEAVKNAKYYGARSHAVQIESILPLIASKVIDEKQHEKDKFLIGSLIFLIVAVLLFFLLVIYRNQILRIKANERIINDKNKELEKVNGKLWESSKIKEELIGLFFKTCSSYIEMLDKVKRKTQHNIKLGKYNDANVILNNIHIETEKDQLYHTLDTVFITLFPNFIVSFNALLRKEDQIWPKPGEIMTATHRIFALTRLGVSELEAIAKILDYSVSTVYTYKARVKAKALVHADEFEQKIMEIKFMDEP